MDAIIAAQLIWICIYVFMIPRPTLNLSLGAKPDIIDQSPPIHTAQIFFYLLHYGKKYARK